jgi:hypothetical protein
MNVASWCLTTNSCGGNCDNEEKVRGEGRKLHNKEL